MQASGTGDN